MRQEDKEVDGFELEEAEERKRGNELVEEDEEELHDLDGKPELSRDEGRSTVVLGAMHKILERDHIVLDNLEVEQRELRALEALKTAVEGRDQEINGFVYAEDRRTLLEQALAVLQPDIASLEASGGKAFEELVEEIGELRTKLGLLEDAQEELVEGRAQDYVEEASDDEDKPKPEPDDDQTLTGPERKIAKPASELAGPERKQEPKPASTLTGPERKDEPKPASTLAGPERKDEPRPPTTLGDPKEIAAAAVPSWKKVPGG